jgi:hypothetical protein
VQDALQATCTLLATTCTLLLLFPTQLQAAVAGLGSAAVACAPVMLHPQCQHKLDVLLILVEVVRSNIASCIPVRVSRLLAEGVPNAGRAPSFIPCPLNLQTTKRTSESLQ